MPTFSPSALGGLYPWLTRIRSPHIGGLDLRVTAVAIMHMPNRSRSIARDPWCHQAKGFRWHTWTPLQRHEQHQRADREVASQAAKAGTVALKCRRDFGDSLVRHRVTSSPLIRSSRYDCDDNKSAYALEQSINNCDYSVKQDIIVWPLYTHMIYHLFISIPHKKLNNCLLVIFNRPVDWLLTDFQSSPSAGHRTFW